MLFLILCISLILSHDVISMEPFEVIDEIARSYAAEVRFKQETLDPVFPTVNPSPPVDDMCINEYLMPCVNQTPMRKKNKGCREAKNYDFVLGGKIYTLHFSISKRERKKSRPHLTDWFNNALDLISSSKKQRKLFPLVLSFSVKTGKIRFKKNYKPKPPKPSPTETLQGVKVQKSIEKKITKEQAQQWLYFRQVNTKKDTQEKSIN